MLQEHLQGRRKEEESEKRYFSDEDFDLFVWLNSGEIQNFQLSYDKKGYERIIVWSNETGYSHHGVSTGEGGIMRHKESPILVTDGEAPTMVLEKFRIEAKNLDWYIYKFVLRKLESYFNSSD